MDSTRQFYASCHARHHAAGFSLLEVLISLVILSVGLLGIAGLMSTTLKSNDSAYMRTQATTLAYNVIDRMRANLSSAKAGAYNLAMPYIPPPSASSACTAGACTAGALAAYDLNQWEYDLNTILPQGQGAISISASGGVTNVTVKVLWNDSRANQSLQGTGAPVATSLSVSSAL
ncbi:MAG: type IV pilus modification protein PilV [Gammaproteobacteria bacterium]